MDAIDSINALQSRQVELSQPNRPREATLEKFGTFEHSLSAIDDTPVGGEKAVSQTDEATKKLQTMFISELVSELFKEETKSTFGEGTQGDFYASLFADKIAEQLAERDILGFEKMLSAEK